MWRKSPFSSFLLIYLLTLTSVCLVHLHRPQVCNSSRSVIPSFDFTICTPARRRMAICASTKAPIPSPTIPSQVLSPIPSPILLNTLWWHKLVNPLSHLCSPSRTILVLATRVLKRAVQERHAVSCLAHYYFQWPVSTAILANPIGGHGKGSCRDTGATSSECFIECDKKCVPSSADFSPSDFSTFFLVSG